jgi:nucleoside-diphosphate kinase
MLFRFILMLASICPGLAATTADPIGEETAQIQLQSVLKEVPVSSVNENTLVILKPDCMSRKLYGAVIDRIQQTGLEMIACKMMKLSTTILNEHYSHLVDRPFFPEIVEFMQEYPMLVLVFHGTDGVKKVQDLLGPTDSKQAAAGTIRGDFGTDNMKNIAHASDSADSAQKEVKRFFSDAELFP